MKNIKFTNGRGMSKIVAMTLIIASVLTTGLLGVKEYCLPHEIWNAMGLDPNASSWTETYNGEANVRMENALINHPELFDLNDPEAQAILKKHGKSSSGAASTQPATSTPTQSGGKSDKGKATVKVTAYFTDMYGHVIGSSQITSGTTISDSQFVQEVPDCNGKKFDGWDYDGKVMTNDYIVRALFK